MIIPLTRLIPLKCWWAPRIVYIEPTDTCNLKCVMCPQTTSTHQRGFMKFELFERVVSELPKASRVHLYYRGEPLLHPRISEMISCVLERGNKLSITTNGTLPITAGHAASRLMFSFDGSNKEVYEGIRRGAKYDEVLHNIESAVRSGAFCKVVVEIIDMPQSVGYVRAFARQMYALGVDEVRLKKFLHWDAPCQNGFSNIVPCVMPWHTLGIFWDGTITPCCVDYEGTLAIGNANTTTILEAWNNEAIVALRRRVREHSHSCKDAKTLLRPHKVVR